MFLHPSETVNIVENSGDLESLEACFGVNGGIDKSFLVGYVQEMEMDGRILYHYRTSVCLTDIADDNMTWLVKKNLGAILKGSGSTVLAGLPGITYSQVLSHYCPMWGILPAAFLPWACAPLLRQPGNPDLRRGNHIDTGLSMDTRST